MLEKLGVLVFSILVATSQLAYAHAPKQPDTIGQYDIGSLTHIGTIVCPADHIQIAVYGNFQELIAFI